MSNEMRYGLKDLSIGGSLDLKLLIAYLWGFFIIVEKNWSKVLRRMLHYVSKQVK